MKNQDWTHLFTSTGTALALIELVRWLLGFAEPYIGPYLSEVVLWGLLTCWALRGGLPGALLAGALEPLCSFVLGIGPGPFAAIPAMSLSNLVIAAGAYWVLSGTKLPLWKKLILLGGVSIFRFVLVYCSLVWVMIPVMGPNLAFRDEEILVKLFSWHQIFTGFLGTALGIPGQKLLKK